MDRLPLTGSESHETDSIAQDRWDSEGGNPGELRQLPGHKTEETTTGASRKTAIAELEAIWLC